MLEARIRVMSSIQVTGNIRVMGSNLWMTVVG
jgi:hypothetical protein